MDGRDELIRLRGEEIDRLNVELRELAKHADHLNSRIVALDHELERCRMAARENAVPWEEPVTWVVKTPGKDASCTHPSDKHSYGMTGSKALCVECGAWLVAE